MRYDIKQLKADIREMNRLRRDPKAWEEERSKTLPAIGTNRYDWRAFQPVRDWEQAHSAESATLLYMAAAHLRGRLHFRRHWILNPSLEERQAGIHRVIEQPTLESQGLLVGQTLARYEIPEEQSSREIG